MTHTETVSARIARLEAQAHALPDLYRREEALSVSLAQVCRQIQEGEAALRILPAVEAQIDRMLTSGALIAGTDAPASSESNSESNPENLPINPAHIAAPDPAPEAETPASTPEVAAEDMSNSEPNPETNSEETPETAPPPTAFDRVRAWLTDQDADIVFGAADVVDALELPGKSTGAYLSRLMKMGEIERLPGTGLSGVPSRYRLPGSAAGEVQTPEAAPEQDAPPTAPPVLSAPQMSLRGQVMAHFRAHPLDEFTAEQVAERLLQPAPAPLVQALMLEMHRSGALSVSPEAAEGQQWFFLPRPEEPAGAPAGTPIRALPPVPERLDVDQRSLFDCLRREEGGLPQRLLSARLNWSSGRTQRVLDALVKEGHVGRNGDRLRVIPDELRGQA